jgi:hypothetical protein
VPLPLIDARRIAAALAVAGAAAALAAAPSPAPAQTTTTPATAPVPCGAATLPTVASVVDTVADNIYEGELHGGEVVTDRLHVTESTALLKAVAAGNRHAAWNAVHRLVYHSLWHIVRLRVLSTSGQVLAEVGGPYVIAPVTGVLRLGGQVIGSYVMSVQDDYGFTLLESHAAGDPIAVYYEGRNVADTGAPLPKTQPTGPTLTLGGVTYLVVSHVYNAFPTGTLTAVILIPPPAPSLAQQACGAVRAAEILRVAELLAARFHPLDVSYDNFVTVVHDDTGATVILRIGARAIPGSQGIGPPVLPQSGALTFLGRDYWVESFEPTPPARIYLLIEMPAAPATAG